MNIEHLCGGQLSKSNGICAFSSNGSSILVCSGDPYNRKNSKFYIYYDTIKICYLNQNNSQN